MPPSMRLAALTLPVLIAGCSGYGIGPENRQFPACPSFQVPTTSINLTAGGGTFPLGDVTLIVPAGSVTAPVQVAVSRGTIKRNAAAVAFTPFGGQALSFSKSVTLGISYARCPAADFVRPVVYRVDGASDQRRPTTAPNSSQYVEGSLDSFSEYALAVE